MDSVLHLRLIYHLSEVLERGVQGDDMFEITITLTSDDGEELGSASERFADPETAGNCLADLSADLGSMGRES